jgi:hypothetical protein
VSRRNEAAQAETCPPLFCAHNLTAIAAGQEQVARTLQILYTFRLPQANIFSK